MKNFLLMSLGVVLTSCYLFPFELVYLPGLNFKMLMAGLSIPLLMINMARRSDSLIEKDFIIVSLFTLPITIFSLLTTVINGTSEESFTYYFVSVFVWMGAAYFLSNVLKAIHGEISMKVMIQYLIAVCCLQCVLALTMEYFPSLQVSIDGVIGGSEMFMTDGGGRLHGIGCALDVAGGRFAAVLVMTSVLMVKATTRVEIGIYLLAFSVIAVVGNMMARTTTIGLIISALVIVVSICYHKPAVESLGRMVLTFVIAVFIVVALAYNSNSLFRQNLRFGFEGFFSLVETGHWQTGSNDILLNHMVVFPDNYKTWIIGDGYCSNPSEWDPFYTGKKYHGFYKGTDIGYLRYIFYFGILGALAMLAFFTCVGCLCIKRHNRYKLLIILLMILNMILLVKATTDLLPIFALLFCLPIAGDTNRVIIE